MTKEEIEFVLKENNYLKGGTKEACLKVKHYMKKIQSIESKSSTEFKEFLECINTLLAFSFPAKDTIPTKYCCDNDCKYSGFLLCAGEFNTDDKSENICPYYTQER